MQQMGDWSQTVKQIKNKLESHVEEEVASAIEADRFQARVEHEKSDPKGWPKDKAQDPLGEDL